MMKNITLTFLFLFLCHTFLSAQKVALEYNKNCENIYNTISALKIKEATALIQTEMAKNPNNAMPVLLTNYIDFYELFFNENPTEYKNRKDNEAKRISVIENTNEQSPYYLFSKALIYFQWSLVKAKFKDRFSAAKDMRKAYLLFTENKKKYPNFSNNDLYLGALQAVVGSLPNSYKILASIMGISGNLQQGMQLVNNASADKNFTFTTDAIFLNVYLNQYILHKENQVWENVKKLKPKAKDNRLYSFIGGNLAINQNKATEALEYILPNYAKTNFMSMPILDYELGCAYLNSIDGNCVKYFLNYIANCKGNLYLKDACFKLSIYYYITNQQALSEVYKNKILTIGTAEAEADKSALAFANSTMYDHKELYKARFYTDGGFLKEALNCLAAIQTNELKTDAQQIEYNYRTARIFDKMEQYEKALTFYNITYAIGKNSTEYFAARAAVQAGLICEKLNKKTDAATYYTKCLQLEEHQFKNSLDQQAKAGLQRVK